MRSVAILFMVMVFFHIIADYNMQGILASMKCRSWWEKNYPDEHYKYDYIAALIAHSYMWSVMIHIPAIIYVIYTGEYSQAINTICATIVVNTCIHGYIDNAKANSKDINLIMDQILHLVQLIAVAMVYC